MGARSEPESEGHGGRRRGLLGAREPEVDAAVAGFEDAVAALDDAPTALDDETAAAVAEVVSTARTALEVAATARRSDRALIRAGQALSATLQLREVLPAILRELRGVVHYDTASVQELRGDQVVIVSGSGIDLDVFDGVGFDVDDPGAPNGDVVNGHRPVIVGDILGAHHYANFPHPAHRMSGVRSWMGVPLLFGDECLGMLTLDAYEPDFYDVRHARIAMAFAGQAAVALQNARTFARAEALRAELREQAIRDPLTGLFNRRYLMETLERELAHAARDGRPLSVVVIDVDRFKQVNDSLGHEGGDKVLAAVARHLADQVREGDVACRYGGEEFVVLLPGVDLPTALRRADAWRVGLREAALPGLPEAMRITVSAGVAEAPSHGSRGDALVDAADQAMYAAKRAGRDRVAAADAASLGAEAQPPKT